jgi:hypothetical protein
MDLRSFIHYLRRYAYRRRIDWTLKNGDVVVSDGWPKPIEIIDINWALHAAAVRVGADPNAIISLAAVECTPL